MIWHLTTIENQLQKGLVGDFLLEIKGLDGAYAFGRFTIH